MEPLFMASADGGTILFIIALIWAILNIILFFKIWEMTNNISKIKKKVADTTFHRLFILGHMEEAYELLIVEIYDKLFERVGALNDPTYFKKCLNEVIEEYAPRFDALGAEMSDEITTLTFEKWCKGFA